MFTRIRNMHPVTGIVIGVVVTLVLSGTAIAVTDTSFTYSTVRTGYLMIGPGDLVPENSTVANNYALNFPGPPQPPQAGGTPVSSLRSTCPTAPG